LIWTFSEFELLLMSHPSMHLPLSIILDHNLGILEQWAPLHIAKLNSWGK
jgi:hypothetical protein